MKNENQITALATALIILIICPTESASAREIERGTVSFSAGSEFRVGSSVLKTPGETDTKTDKSGIDLFGFYYLSKNVGIGGTWLYENEKSTQGQDVEKTKSNLIGPAFIFSHSVTESTNFSFSGAAVFGKIETGNGDITTEVDGDGWSLGLNINHFLTDSMSIDTGFNYTSLSFDGNSLIPDVDIDGAALAVSLSVYLN